MSEKLKLEDIQKLTDANEQNHADRTNNADLTFAESLERDLLPCPFCGSKAARLISSRKWNIHCSNNECFMSMAEPQFYKTFDQAESVWNTRARPSSEGSGEGAEIFERAQAVYFADSKFHLCRTYEGQWVASDRIGYVGKNCDSLSEAYAELKRMEGEK